MEIKHNFNAPSPTVMGNFQLDNTNNEHAAFLAAHLDPFHDTPIKHVTGLPDATPTTSIVQKVKQSFTLQSPFGSGNWNTLIMSNPFFAYSAEGPCKSRTRMTMYDSNGYPTTDVLSASTSKTGYSGISIQCTQSSTTLDTPNVDSIQPPRELLSAGAFRIIGCGFEVTNTTAEINKQGSVHVFRLPSNKQRVSYRIRGAAASTPPYWCKLWDGSSLYGSPAFPYTGSMINFNEPPNTVSEVDIIPGSSTWSAAEGCYCVNQFTEMPEFVTLSTCPISKGAGITTAVRVLGSEVESVSAGLDNSVLVQINGDQPGESPYTGMQVAAALPLDYVGAYFTGLSEQTTLSIVATWYIEIVPRPDNTALAPLMAPSCTYFDELPYILSRVYNQMPCGVPVEWNASGKWFKNLKKILRFAEKMNILGAAGAAAQSVPHPYAQMAAQGLIAADKALKQSNRSKKKKRKD